MKIQLKRSNQLEGGEAKKPSVSQMEYGELAVNYNTEDPALFIKDSADQIVKLKIAPAATVLIADTAPDISDSEIGTLWWNSSEDSGQLFILYDDPSGGGGGDVGGPKWIEASPTTGGSGSGGAEVLVSETAPVIDDLEEGSLWWNSSSTDLQLYVLYNDNGTKKWVEASPTVGDAGSEDDFVNVTGDNMTGNLTLGTDKITLDASDGSATFADGNINFYGNGNVVVGDDPFTSSGTRIYPTGRVLIGHNNGSGVPIVSDIYNGGNATFNLRSGGELLLGGTDAGGPTTSNIYLNGSDGSAEFTGTVQTDSAFYVKGGSYTHTIGTEADSGGTDNRAMAFWLASTAGEYRFNSASGNNAAIIKADGSAKFAGTIEQGNFNTSSSSGFGIKNLISSGSKTGVFNVQHAWDASATANAFAVYKASSNGGTVNPTVEIKGDGSATFKNEVSVDRPASSSTSGFRVFGDGAIKSTLFTDGSAEFKKVVVRPETSVNIFTGQGVNGFNNAVYVSTIDLSSPDTSNHILCVSNSSTEVFKVSKMGNGYFRNAIFNLEPDNPANYTTTTDSEGNETSVYNGPTLDVKDRLQNLISRLDALESDEIADDATSTLLLTTVNNINAQMTKVNNALTAIRNAANTAGTLDQLKTDIAAATADI